MYSSFNNCLVCGGTGRKKVPKIVPCSSCTARTARYCRSCKGSRKVVIYVEEICHSCGGSGKRR